MRIISLGMLLALVCTACAVADDPSVERPLEPASTTSPKATLKTFMESFREGYSILEQQDMRRGALSANQRAYFRNRIEGCFDLSDVPPALRTMQLGEAVTFLKETLDRIDLPPETEWPDDAQVAESGIDRWTIPHTEITIAKAREGPKQGQYLFTPDTVERAAEFYERVRHLPYQDRPTTTPGAIRYYQAEPGTMLPRDWIRGLPAWAHSRPGGQAIWQWLGLACVLVMSLLLMLAAYLIGLRSSRLASATSCLSRGPCVS